MHSYSKVNQQNLKIVVTKGHRDDVAFLLQQIDTFLAATGWFDFFLFLPNGWHFANSERLRTWLESAGFEEPVPGKFVFPDHRAVRVRPWSTKFLHYSLQKYLMPRLRNFVSCSLTGRLKSLR